MQLVPRVGFVRHQFRSLGDAGLDESDGGRFGPENLSERAPVALADRDHNATLSILVDREPTVAAVFDMVRGLDVTTEIAAMNLRDFALAANVRALHFGRDGLTELVRQNEGRLVLDVKIARERQRGFAFDLVAEDRDCGEIGPQRELMEGEQRPAGQRE